MDTCYFQVAWIHIDRQMILTIHRHVISRVPRFSVSHDNAKTWLLHVNSVQQEDRGYYMCQVNTNPMISQVGYLQVVGKFACVISLGKSNQSKYQYRTVVRFNRRILWCYKVIGLSNSKFMPPGIVYIGLSLTLQCNEN